MLSGGGRFRSQARPTSLNCTIDEANSQSWTEVDHGILCHGPLRRPGVHCVQRNSAKLEHRSMSSFVRIFNSANAHALTVIATALISRVAKNASIPRDRPERLPRTLTQWRADFLGGAIGDDSGMAANGSSVRRILGSFRKINCLVFECRSSPARLDVLFEPFQVQGLGWGGRELLFFLKQPHAK